MMLKINDLNTHYGAIHALKGISMEVKKGEIVSLIGSNGAGKTTLLNTIVGVTRASKGTVTFKEKDITNVPSHMLTKMKISISPEGREVFPDLTVEENLRLGAYVVKDKGQISAGYDRVYDLFPRLKERYKQQAGTLSGGEQQMLAIGRAIMGHPRLLMLDEPSMGLAPLVIDELFEKIVEINKSGTPVLLVEQNAKLALKVSDRAYILERGNISLSGKSKDLINDKRVTEAYLGKSR